MRSLYFDDGGSCGGNGSETGSKSYVSLVSALLNWRWLRGGMK